jgi:DNA-binding NtrC family response regulator
VQQVDPLDHGAGKVGSEGCNVALLCIPSVDHALLQALDAAAPRWRHLEVIAIVGPGVIDDEVTRDFIHEHCIDYQHQPIDHERLMFALGHAEGMGALAHRTRDISVPTPGTPRGIIGRSPQILALRHDVERMAGVDAPVMITGESGTGKELVARALHDLSARRHGPFVAVNCVSLPPSLIHAELFGFEKGAFTGAHKRKTGHLEAAHGGTIFLDEIGDLTLELQALLLRFLEERKVRRVGGRDEIEVNVRVLAATNIDLEAAVRKGTFREDLYYRLNVLRLQMPPLRERKEDVELLASAFLELFAGDRPGRRLGFSPSALRAMEQYDWPGNVRELMNRVRRAIVMAEGRQITEQDLQLGSGSPERRVQSLEEVRGDAERDAVIAAMRQSAGDGERVAQLLGISRATLYRLLRRHGLSLEEAEREAGLGPLEREAGTEAAGRGRPH